MPYDQHMQKHDIAVPTLITEEHRLISRITDMAANITGRPIICSYLRDYASVMVIYDDIELIGGHRREVGHPLDSDAHTPLVR